MRKSKLNEFLTNTGFFKGFALGLLLLYIIILVLSNFDIEPTYAAVVLFLLATFVFFLSRYYERKNKIEEEKENER